MPHEARQAQSRPDTHSSLSDPKRPTTTPQPDGPSIGRRRRLRLAGRAAITAAALPSVVTLALAMHSSRPTAPPLPMPALQSPVAASVAVRATASEVRPSLVGTPPLVLVSDAVSPTRALETTLTVALERASTALAVTSPVPAPVPEPESQAAVAVEPRTAGPTLQQLRDAQTRVATTQLSLQLLLDRMTPEQAAAAEDAAATATADLTQALHAE